ncbi:hypothetical protein [Psychroserpens luteus]|uniref:Initiator Replication protein n=1 Tax=Psychroserpens luteus TaxID=1434066 RepID=A0ABW5ZW02_9FLAO|nr:hypothetical protein [Psychroserpens luteus]
MATLEDIINPHYNKKRGMTVGFLISVIFCSERKDIEDQVIVIMYIANAIEYDLIKHNRDKLTKRFLLQRIFDLSANKKYVSKLELRQLVNMEDKGTFNKYYNKHLLELGLTTNKRFTLSELYKILEINQGSHDWNRLAVYSKRELANEYKNGNYEDLELEMTNKIFDFETYKNRDYILPADAHLFIKNKASKKDNNIDIADYEKDQLSFFFYSFLLYSFKSQFNPRIKN